MARLGLLFPFQEMLEIAKTIIEEEKIDVAYMKVITTAEAVSEARKAIEAGADIVVSRGQAASLIKKNTNVPLIEMRIHAQEIGLLIKRAKEFLKKELPHIGIVCYKNMLCDMNNMAELFDVKLSIVYIENAEESFSCVAKLKERGVDFIIGGAATCEDANSIGIPALIYGSSVESIKESFRESQKMAYAMEVEKRNEAQFETVLDTTFNGIIKINAEGNIIVINKLVENLIGEDMKSVLGKRLLDIFPEFDEKRVNAILSGEADNYTLSVNIRKQTWLLTMAPIQYNEMITGAILSLHKLQENVRTNNQLQKNMYMNGYVADTLFTQLKTCNEQMKEEIELARRYALSDRPVVLVAEEGTEYYAFAEAIHNGSARKNGPFVSVNLESMDEEEQFQTLFAHQTLSAFSKAENGTLFIRGIEQAGRRVQNYLARMLGNENIARTDVQQTDTYNVRLVFMTKMPLEEQLEREIISEELFYEIQGLTIHILPLRQRKEDLEEIFKKYFSEFCKKYNKYLVLTNGALEKIKSLKWKGNQIQICSFCERLVLTSDKRSVDEVKIQKIYEILYPKIISQRGEKKIVVYENPESEEIHGLLEKYHGNRSAIAKELGISTTTLWRKMKKYGLE